MDKSPGKRKFSNVDNESEQQAQDRIRENNSSRQAKHRANQTTKKAAEVAKQNAADHKSQRDHVKAKKNNERDQLKEAATAARSEAVANMDPLEFLHNESPLMVPGYSFGPKPLHGAHFVFYWGDVFGIRSFILRPEKPGTHGRAQRHVRPDSPGSSDRDRPHVVVDDGAYRYEDGTVYVFKTRF